MFASKLLFLLLIAVYITASSAATRTPTRAPSRVPTRSPTIWPSKAPTASPTEFPTEFPTELPTESPTFDPTSFPTPIPTPPKKAGGSKPLSGGSVAGIIIGAVTGLGLGYAFYLHKKNTDSGLEKLGGSGHGFGPGFESTVDNDGL